MECNKCKGKGWNENPRYNPIASTQMYENGIESRKKCKPCKGIGYIIGNIQDVMETLIVLRNNYEWDKERLNDINDCINAIES